jgi:hypothetical protein
VRKTQTPPPPHLPALPAPHSGQSLKLLVVSDGQAYLRYQIQIRQNPRPQPSDKRSTQFNEEGKLEEHTIAAKALFSSPLFRIANRAWLKTN